MDFDLVKEPVDERAIKVGPDQVGQFVRDLVCRAGGNQCTVSIRRAPPEAKAGGHGPGVLRFPSMTRQYSLVG